MSQTAHDGVNQQTSSTSSATPALISQQAQAGTGNNALKRPFDEEDDDSTAHETPRICDEVVSNRSAAVQPDKGEWWEDSRLAAPRNWKEVEALQEALAPTIRTFATISGRVTEEIPLPEISPWTSYANHYRVLQMVMLEAWQSDRRLGPPPRLAGLCAWSGGIMAWREARVQTSEEALTPFIHPRILAPRPRARSLLWHQDWAREWFHGDEEDRRRQEAIEIQAMQRDLVQRQAAPVDLRKKAIAAQARENTPAQRQAAEQAAQASTEQEGFLVRIMSDSVIARDPTTFRKFLYQLGFRHYTKGAHTAMSWKSWCVQVAPPFYERLVASNSAASTATQNTPSVVSAVTNGRSPSPEAIKVTITLEQARLGNERHEAAKARRQATQTEAG